MYQSLNASGNYVLSGEVSDDFGQHFGPAGTLGTDDLFYKWRGDYGYRWDGDGLWTGSYNEPIVEVGARYYIPSMGVFLTRDGDLTQRPYEYCDADPVNYVDASGYAPTMTNEGEYKIGTGLVVGGAVADVTGFLLGMAVAATIITAPAWLVPTLIVGGAAMIIAGTIMWSQGGDPHPGAPWFTGPVKPVKVHPIGYRFIGSDPTPAVFVYKGGGQTIFGDDYGGDTTQTSGQPAQPNHTNY